MAKTTKPIYRGHSSDWRTNRWSVICPACEKSFDPMTTMLRFQSLTCENKKCLKEMVADYNDEIVWLKE